MRRNDGAYRRNRRHRTTRIAGTSSSATAPKVAASRHPGITCTPMTASRTHHTAIAPYAAASTAPPTSWPAPAPPCPSGDERYQHAERRQRLRVRRHHAALRAPPGVHETEQQRPDRGEHADDLQVVALEGGVVHGQSETRMRGSTTAGT